MSIDDMRSRILSAYPGPKWHKKVMNMTDGQIYAVHARLTNEGKLK